MSEKSIFQIPRTQTPNLEKSRICYLSPSGLYGFKKHYHLSRNRAFICTIFHHLSTNMTNKRMSSENLLRRAVRAKLDKTGIFVGDFQPQELQSSGFSCFPLAPQRHDNYILYKNILWCEAAEADEKSFEITFVNENGKKLVIEKLVVELPLQDNTAKHDVASEILAKSYGESKIAPLVLIVLNNFGGQGRARHLYKHEILPVLKAAHVEITYVETEYSQHGIDIGREADLDKYDIVACCSGDGVPHEIINGMYQRADRARAFSKLAVTQLPCGSGNALSLSTHGSNVPGIAAFQMLKAQKAKLDLMAVTQGIGESETTKLSFLSQAYGVIADSDIGTEHLRWMGPIRFELGVTHKVLTKAKYPCDLYVSYAAKDSEEMQRHVSKHLLNDSTEHLDINEENFKLKYPLLDSPAPELWEKLPPSVTDKLNIFYVGNMPYVSNDAQFFPAALPDDGHMDLIITDTTTPFFKMAKILMSVDNGGHVHSDQTHHAKITAYRLVPRIKDNLAHYISVDGEDFPFEAMQVEVLPKLLTVLLQSKTFVETSYTSG